MNKKKFHKSAIFIKLFWYYEIENNKRHVFHIHKEMVKENEEIMVKKIM